MMAPDQEQHLQWIKDQFSRMIDKKYRNGAAEHQGRLWHTDCLREATLEALDLIAYLFTEAMLREADKPDSIVSPIFKRPADPAPELEGTSRGQANKVRGCCGASSAEGRAETERKGNVRPRKRRGGAKCSSCREE